MLTLDSARKKLNHARVHFDRLKQELRTFEDREPFVLTCEEEDGKVQIRAVVREPIPETVSLFLGDCLHNLRAALDHVVYEAVGRPSTRCEWPMPNRDGKMPTGKYVREAACPGQGDAAALRTFIRSLDPSAGGADEWLWTLHRLDIIDKHRLLLTVCAATDSVQTVEYLDGYEVSRDDPDQVTVLPNVGESVITWVPEVRYPLEDGTVIQEFPAGTKVKSIKATLSTAVGEGSLPVSGERLEQVTQSLIDGVHSLLEDISQKPGLGRS